MAFVCVFLFRLHDWFVLRADFLRDVCVVSDGMLAVVQYRGGNYDRLTFPRMRNSVSPHASVTIAIICCIISLANLFTLKCY